MRALIVALFAAAALLPAARAADKDEKKKVELKNAPKGEFTPIGEVTTQLAKAPDGKGNTIALKVAGVSAGARGRAQPKMQDENFELTADVQVRFLKAPTKKDDDGKETKLSAKELKELRGDGKLKGYAAQLSDLQPGQIVTVQFVKMKGEKTDANTKKFINRIYIVGDGPPVAEKQPEKKKK